jgi:hypothetical protein
MGRDETGVLPCKGFLKLELSDLTLKDAACEQLEESDGRVAGVVESRCE